jgi:CRISPR-associated exonuclease Cas4
VFTEDDLLPISALQHLLFCPRQCALIHVERLWAENRLTVEGRHLHERADSGRGESRGARRRDHRDRAEGATPAGALRIARGLLLRSFAHGVWGKADVVEFHPAGSVHRPGVFEQACSAPVPFPIEYKRGKPKKDGSDRVQLCAQALCLEEMLNTPVPAGGIFYARTRRREDVVFDEPLRTLTLNTIERLHEMIASGRTPPAVREKKCDRCSLKSLCLPEVLQGREPASRYLRRSIALVAQAMGPALD